MATYIVTTSNWNNAAFWASISEAGPGHTLDFSALPSNFSVDFWPDGDRVVIDDGASTFTIGDSDNASPSDAQMSGTTQLEYFTVTRGSQGDDLNDGGIYNDTLEGGGGSDTLSGNGGNDLLSGDAGNDRLSGGDGSDTLLGGGGNDSLFGDLGNDSLNGGTGTNFLDGGAGADTLDGSGGEYDIATYQASGQAIFIDLTDGLSESGGDAQGDSLIGIEQVDGSEFNDTLIADDAGMELQGRGGNDFIFGGDGGDRLTGGAGNDQLFGGFGNDTISGGDGNDLIQGEQGNDTIDGGAGDDTINITDFAGTDQIDGGESAGDRDAFQFFSGTPIALTFNSLEDGTYAFSGGGSASGTFANIEHFEGGSGQDTLDFSAVSDALTVTFLGASEGEITDGTDTITFAGIEQIILTDESDVVDGRADTAGINIDAGNGDDTVVGGVGDDTLNGESGNDEITGGAGSDQISGGSGNDTFVYEDGFGNDTIDGGIDTDAIDMSAVSGPVTVVFTDETDGTITNTIDTITFSDIEQHTLTEQNDSVDATITWSGLIGDRTGIDIDARGGSDTVLGGRGGDTIDGGDGNDLIDGDYGDDSLIGSGGNDTIIGGQGNDTVLGGDGNDSLDAGVEADTIEGGAGSDTVDAGDGDDLVTGGSGDDIIAGGQDDDTIEGGTGDDLLTGGDENDVFIYNVGDGNDTISDFNSGNNGTLLDGDSSNNDFIDLSSYYDNLSELYADQADDNILNQSNDGQNGVDYSDNTSFGAGSLRFDGASADSSSFTAENTGVTCFTEGTLIETPNGPVLIEDLRIGALVTTADNGPKPVRWIGRQTLKFDDLQMDERLRPVLIAPNVLGNSRKLLVSQQHGVMVHNDGLMRAKHLVATTRGVRIAHGKRHVTYVHLMFDAHQILFAEGARAESFYPGPTALSMLGCRARNEVFDMLPELSQSPTRSTVRKVYGATARHFVQSCEASVN